MKARNECQHREIAAYKQYHSTKFHGYQVYILPNPKGLRTPDFMLERKGIYRVYDLKTIIGKNSAVNRLRESIGQANRVLLKHEK